MCNKVNTASIFPGIVALFILSLLPLFLTACSRRPDIQQGSGIYFDTAVSMTVYATGDPKEEVLTQCFSLASYYEDLFSRTREGSDIWNINHAEGKPVSCNEETITLLTYALTIADQTEGKIDPTIEPLAALWDFSSASSVQKGHSLPSEDAIQSALSHVDYHNVVIQDDTVTLTDPQAGLDLGFVAKGYIADRILDYLKTRDNVSGAVINLGGNVVFYGEKDTKNPFKLGIQKPFADTGTPLATASWKSSSEQPQASFVTSGIYERYFIYEDQLYHHILDTSTGYPVSPDIQSVTIYSDSSMEGDAYSTTCLILGAKEGLRYIESIDNAEALFVLVNGEIRTTSGFPAYELVKD